MSTTGTFLCDLIFEAFLRLNIALLAQTSQRGLRKEITMCPIPLRNIVAGRSCTVLREFWNILVTFPTQSFSSFITDHWSSEI